MSNKGIFSPRDMKFLHKFTGRLGLPMPRVVIERAKAAAPHAVDIQGPSQVIDLMLQNAGVPAFCFYLFQFSGFVQSPNPHSPSTRDHGHEARQAKAAFKEA
jgi:hypothetical protein